ncbi:5'-3' exonuclease PLD4 [Aplochiton taeniatus]
MGCLTVLGLLLALCVLERPSLQDSSQHSQVLPATRIKATGGSEDQCRMALVESIPLFLDYPKNATFGIPLDATWRDLISMATTHLDMASFYWSLTGDDINVNSSTDLPGRDILKRIGTLPARNVSVRVVSSIPTVKNNSTDLKILRELGVQARRVNCGRLTHGVLHSKFWIVDRKHVYIGSANMDWRSLTQVKELGVVIYNCSSLAEDLQKIFDSYWLMGKANSSIPRPWPSEFDTGINRHHPLVLKDGNAPISVYLTGSPPSFCPATRTLDLEAILSVIRGAQDYVHVSVMDYFPTTRFHHPQRYWPVIDDALRKTAFERNVKIRMLISCGRNSDPAMLPFLRSLEAMHDPSHNISIQVKLYILPLGNQSDIPYSRVNHNKFMVSEKVAYIGTSNWAADYFSTTAGVGLVASHPGSQGGHGSLHAQLGAVFIRDWTSQFAVRLSDLAQHPDCSLTTRALPFASGHS